MNWITNILKRKEFLIVLKLLVLLFSVFYIYENLSNPHHISLFANKSELIALLIKPQSVVLLLIVFVLSFINISIEAIKWKFITSKLIVISIRDSIIGVYLGFCLGFITPHGIGDYFARITSLDNNNRAKLAISLFLSRISLLLVTIILATIGIYYMLENTKLGHHYLFAYIIGCIILLVGYFALPIVFVSFFKIRFFKKYLYFIDLIIEYTKMDLIYILALSFFRYLVFSVQFVILFYLFGIKLPVLVLFAGTTYIFLLKSVLPTFNFLGDLSIREFAALSFFTLFQILPDKVVLASLILWIINIVIPSIIGFSFLNRIKFLK